MPSGADKRWGAAELVVMGASTGGPTALASILSGLPKTFPLPIAVVQHMPEAFTRTFAARLNQESSLQVFEAAKGNRLRPGTVAIAPGGRQMRVHRDLEGWFVELGEETPWHNHVPSVDVLFDSAARAAHQPVIAVLLTGMGKDGAEGMEKIHRRGGITIAQSKESSVVFGMPRAAIERGCVDYVADLEEIPALLMKLSMNR
ncbi:CheB methylesterase domain-containing protein [Kyrpidia spormannii]|nr:CheB methylesterase domain-containing protein [Kyrpidia spormannii]